MAIVKIETCSLVIDINIPWFCHTMNVKKMLLIGAILLGTGSSSMMKIAIDDSLNGKFSVVIDSMMTVFESCLTLKTIFHVRKRYWRNICSNVFDFNWIYRFSVSTFHCRPHTIRLHPEKPTQSAFASFLLNLLSSEGRWCIRKNQKGRNTKQISSPWLIINVMTWREFQLLRSLVINCEVWWMSRERRR